MVTAYLEIAELQALNRKPMYMKDWISRLDDFLRMTGNDILDHAGTISHQQALRKAHTEYDKFKTLTQNGLSEAEKHFIGHLEKEAKNFPKSKRKRDK